MKLTGLLSEAGVLPEALTGDAAILSVVADSRKAGPGALFVAMPGPVSESINYLQEAASAGAVAAIANHPDIFAAASKLGLSAAWIGGDKKAFNAALCKLCDEAFGHPTRSMKVVGVTGTNGKTTTAWLIRDIFHEMGTKSAYLGTLGFHKPGEERELANTTPFPVELYGILAEARDSGVEALAMEVSSHALEERRSEAVEFDSAVFTNLTQDHLDFHGTMESYEAAKLRLFTELPRQTSKRFCAAINIGDHAGARLLALLDRDRAIPFGVANAEAVLACEPLDIRIDALRLRVSYNGEDLGVQDVPLGGAYNVENVLGAVAGCLGAGADLAAILDTLPRLRPVPGRFEMVPNEEGIGILVDYAHTPDALEKLLDAVAPLTSGRIITVFGCGGDRDRTKRPKMARAASSRSDLTIVTSDNPRTEDPLQILRDVTAGIEGHVDWSGNCVSGAAATAIADRGEAISCAVAMAEPGDVVVIAGKGHENYQIIGRTKHPMDDRQLARDGLRRRRGGRVGC